MLVCVHACLSRRSDSICALFLSIIVSLSVDLYSGNPSLSEHTLTHAHTCEEIFKCARMQIHNENWMTFPGGRRMGTDVFLET